MTTDGRPRTGLGFTGAWKTMCKFCVGMLTGMLACLVCLVVTFKLIQSGTIGPGSGGPQENSEPLPELSDPVPVAPSPVSQTPPPPPPETKVAQSDPPPMQAMDTGSAAALNPALAPPPPPPLTGGESPRIVPPIGDIPPSNASEPPPPLPPTTGNLGQPAALPDPPPPVSPHPVDTLPPMPEPVPPQTGTPSDLPPPPQVLTPPSSVAPPDVPPPPVSLVEAAPPELIPAPSVVEERQVAPITTPAAQYVEDPLLSPRPPVQATPAVRTMPRPAALSLPFIGNYPCTMEDDRKVKLPGSVREQLGDLPMLMLMPGPNRCLILCPPDQFTHLAQSMIHLPFGHRQAELERRLLYSQTERIAPDEQGRIVLSREQVELAGIRKDVTLIGVGNHFELWDAERWQQYRKQNASEEESEQHRVMPPTEKPDR